MTQESQLEVEAGSSESSPPSQSESSAQHCQTLTLDIRYLHHPRHQAFREQLDCRGQCRALQSLSAVCDTAPPPPLLTHCFIFTVLKCRRIDGLCWAFGEGQMHPVVIRQTSRRQQHLSGCISMFVTVSVYICLHGSVSICIWVHLYVFEYISMYLRISVCIYIYVGYISMYVSVSSSYVFVFVLI
jgi:hypothetical protein